jgi:undecaprenyl-phosphate 4-deoxy-4-formamido-L-arabinose transferase
MRNSYTFVDGYFSWITTNVESCKVSHSERKSGKSSYTIPKLIGHTINIFVTFSNLPIRFLTYLSLFVLFSTFSFSVVTIIRKLIFNNILEGYTSIVIILGFGIGLIMLSLGIIGEYIYRISLKTTKRPNYKILEVI